MNVPRFFLQALIVNVLLCFPTHIAAQNNTDDPAQNPSSEAMSVITGISTPIDYSTGAVGVNVPLYTIQSGTVSVPITLNYKASGHQLYDNHSAGIGLGWHLSVGGRITRMIKGKADELDRGYQRNYTRFNKQRWSEAEFDTFTDKEDSDEFPRDRDKRIDTEADIFYFELPGSSGFFFVDHNGNCHCYPSQNIKIEWTNRSPAASGEFKVTDSGGNEYFFSVKESTGMSINPKGQDGKGYNYTSSWRISSIQPLHGDKIEFTYGGIYDNDGIETNRRHQSDGIIDAEAGQSTSLVTGTVKGTMISNTTFYMYPKSIQWNGHKVEIVLSPWVNNDEKSRLSEMRVIISAGDTVRHYSFNRGGMAVDGFLSDIYLKVKNNFQKLYGFEYYLNTSVTPDQDGITPTLPDHWGYSTGRRHRNNEYHFDSTELTTGRIFRQGNDRSPTLEGSKSRVLKRIETGSGGYTEFIYGLHDAVYGTSNTPIDVGGVRIEEIVANDGTSSSTTRYEYTSKNGNRTISSGTIIDGDMRYSRHVGFWGATSNPSRQFTISSNLNNSVYDVKGNHIIYSEVKEILPNNSYIVRKYTSFKSHPDLSVNDYNSYYHIKTNPGAMPSEDRFIQRNSQAHLRGLLTDEIRYDAGDRLISHTRNYYSHDPAQRTEIASYATFKHGMLFYTLMCDFKIVAKYIWRCEPVFLDSTVVYRGPYSLPSTTKYEYLPQYLVPKKVTQVDTLGNRYETIMTYPFEFTGLTRSDTTAQGGALRLIERNVITPLETKTLKNGKVISGNLQLYKGQSIDPIPWKSYILRTDAPIPASGTGAFVDMTKTGHTFWFDYRYEETVECEAYDSQGNLVRYKDNNGVRHTILRESPGQLPVANITNSRLPQKLSSTSYRQESTGSSMFTLPHSQEITIPHAQTATLYVLFINMITNYDYAKVTIHSGSISGPVVWTSPNMSPTPSGSMFTPVEFPVYLQAGTYYIWVRGYKSGYEWIPVSINGNLSINYLRAVTTSTTLNAEYYTSFEQNAGILSPKAKTGSWVRNSAYAISLSNMAPGDYVLTYWKSLDAGTTWTMVRENISINSNSPSKSIGGTGIYIDEVRLIPVDAHITTCTYIPGIGKTSQCDPNGICTYWEYDDLGRVKRILDDDRKVVSEYDYNIKQN